MPGGPAPGWLHCNDIRILQIAEHELHNRALAPCYAGRGCHLALEDNAQAVLVGEVHDAKRADRDIEIDRLDIPPELSAALAALEDAGNDIRQRRLEHVELLGFSQMARLVEVLHREKRNKVRVIEIVVDLEIDHRLDGGGRLEVLDLDLVLERDQFLEYGLQGGEIQPFLAAEIIVDHPLVDAASFGDGVRACFRQAALAEFGEGRLQDLCARGIGIPLLRRLGGFSRLHAWKMPPARHRRNGLLAIFAPSARAGIVDTLRRRELTLQLIRARRPFVSDVPKSASCETIRTSETGH